MFFPCALVDGRVTQDCLSQECTYGVESRREILSGQLTLVYLVI